MSCNNAADNTLGVLSEGAALSGKYRGLFMPLPTLQPRITRDEYDAFVALIKDEEYFCHSYEGWLKKCAEEDEQRLLHGLVTRPVDVNSQEFIDYCMRSGLDPSIYAFCAFVAAKSRQP